MLSTTGSVNLCSTSVIATNPSPDLDPDDEDYKIVVPGHYNAMYYADADADFFDTTLDRLGNCPYRKDTPVDAKINNDSVCKQEITEYDLHCHIAFTEKEEFVIYNFKKEATQNMVQISLRAASKRSKKILVELYSLDMDFLGISKEVQTPGNKKSWNMYDTLVVWDRIDIGIAEKYKMKILFLDGRTNLCSIGIDYVTLVM